MTRKVALLIGVSEYGEGIPSLSAPVNDVEGMKRILEHPKMGGFDDVKVLPNPDSINAMQTAVAEIFANCGKEDLVLLYFSGHGITDDNNRLFLAIKGTSKNYYKATSVPASFVQDTSQDCYAKRQVIILDCCYSGAFAEGWQTKSVGLDIRKELGAEGRVVLTSSSKTQTSFQLEGEELSLYTKYFIEGIETGAADKQGTGKIYVHQIHDYAKGKVQEVKPKQKPDIILDKEGYNIILSQAPIDDPEADFRKLVAKYVENGEISFISKRILKTRRQEWAIAEERASQIIDEVLAPHRQYLANIQLYKEAYQEAVNYQYPLSQQLKNELQDYQNVLGLKNEDVAEIQSEIDGEALLDYDDIVQMELERFNNHKEIESYQNTKDLLISPQGTDFSKLRDLLADGKWKEADEETTRLMLELGDKKNKGYLNLEDCKNFPREELRTIDQLWLKYSDGKFGFSVQKQIYLEVNNMVNKYNKESYEEMGNRLGWKINNTWVSYSNFTFNNDTAPQGHLPSRERVVRGIYLFSLL